MTRNLRYRCLQLLISLSLLLKLGYAAAQTPQGPMATGKPPYNIVFIIVDQRTYGCSPEPIILCRASIAIAPHGVRFEHHFIASPSRATFLTGRPPQYHHVIDQMQFAFVPTLDSKIPNVASVLKGLGYKTATIAKTKQFLLEVQRTPPS